MVEPLPHLTEAESALIARRRRGRNWAMLGILAALSLLFYAITLVKMGQH